MELLFDGCLRENREGRQILNSCFYAAYYFTTGLLSKFDKIWIVDSSVLEALFKKLKSLEDAPKGQLGGKIGVVIDLLTRLPVEIWFKENPRTNDTKLEKDILNLVPANTLLLLDRGFYHFSFWLQLIEQKIHFITRLKKRMRPICRFTAYRTRTKSVHQLRLKQSLQIVIRFATA